MERSMMTLFTRSFLGIIGSISIVLVVITASVMGCTRAATLPSSEWERLDDVTEGDYRIRTYDGHEYATGKFTKTDSTVVISELFRDGKRFEVEPIVVPVEDIESVKKVRLWKPGTAVIVVALVGVAVVVVYASAFAEGLDRLR
jgi:hypothetical protein